PRSHSQVPPASPQTRPHSHCFQTLRSPGLPAATRHKSCAPFPARAPAPFALSLRLQLSNNLSSVCEHESRLRSILSPWRLLLLTQTFYYTLSLTTLGRRRLLHYIRSVFRKIIGPAMLA